jgi:hypothetical protein
MEVTTGLVYACTLVAVNTVRKINFCWRTGQKETSLEIMTEVNGMYHFFLSMPLHRLIETRVEFIKKLSLNRPWRLIGL